MEQLKNKIGLWMPSDILQAIFLEIDKENVNEIITLIVKSDSNLIVRLISWFKASPSSDADWDKHRVCQAGLYLGGNSFEEAAQKRSQIGRSAYFLLKQNEMFNNELRRN